MKTTEALSRFLAESGAPKTDASRRTYTHHVRALAARHPGLDLHQYRTSHLVEYCMSGDPAPNTMRQRRSLLRSFFEWCAYMKFCPSNPAADLKYAVKPGVGNVRMGNWLVEHEIADLLTACPADLLGRRDRVILVPGLFLGLRIHEIAGLRWSQFSADLSRLTFVGKGRKLVQLGVPPQARQELQSWRSEVPAGCDTVYPSFVPGTYQAELVILWDRPMGAGGLRDRVQEAGRRIGIDAFNPHDLRRTYAGILEAKGVPLADISRLLRHNDMGTTSRYLEKNPHRLAELAETFELAL